MINEKDRLGRLLFLEFDRDKAAEIFLAGSLKQETDNHNRREYHRRQNSGLHTAAGIFRHKSHHRGTAAAAHIPH